MNQRLFKILFSIAIVFIASFCVFQVKTFAVNDISSANLSSVIDSTTAFRNAASNFELEMLITNAPDNSTVTLSRDYVMVNTIPINGKNITIDMNNHNIIFNTDNSFVLNKGTLNIEGHGTVWSQSSSSVIIVRGSNTDVENYSCLKIGEGVELRQSGETTGILVMYQANGTAAYGVNIDLAGQISIISNENTTTNCSGILVGGENSPTAKNPPKIVLRKTSVILPGYISHRNNSTGVFAARYCNIISEGTIDRCSACFYLENGSLTIKDGTYKAAGAPIEYFNDKKESHSKVTITGGTFINSLGGDCIYRNTELKDAEIAISGGRFSYYPDIYLVKGKKSEWNNSDRMLHVVDDIATPAPANNNCPSAKFTDVNKNESHWTHKPIDYVLQKGYMTGVSATSFNPNGNVTRGTIAQILYAAEGKPTVSGKSKFTDVKDGKWYTNAITWAATNGIVSGYGNGKFGPDNPITREQMVAIMYKYSELKGYDLTATANINNFADKNKISKYAVNAVMWAVGHKIISGTKNGIEPKGNATRAQIAVILQAYDTNVRK